VSVHEVRGKYMMQTAVYRGIETGEKERLNADDTEKTDSRGWISGFIAKGIPPSFFLSLFLSSVKIRFSRAIRVCVFFYKTRQRKYLDYLDGIMYNSNVYIIIIHHIARAL
jgi:hypothetical protein